MSGEELERTMMGFINRKFDILVATTIIESGLDIPNVNTIFINEADKYGLADLHQLRGRVGRYKHRAYAYLMLESDRPVTPNAVKRLKAIEEFTLFGAGFKIALRDLEIRGAGNILGAEQSGHIESVGYELYCSLLETAAQVLDQPARSAAFRLFGRAQVAGLPPAQTTSRLHAIKLELYRRIGRLRSLNHLSDLRQEMIDRFGPLPRPAETLLVETEIRILAGAWKVNRIHVGAGQYIVLTLRRHVPHRSPRPPPPRLGPDRRRQERLCPPGRRPGQDPRNRPAPARAPAAVAERVPRAVLRARFRRSMIDVSRLPACEFGCHAIPPPPQRGRGSIARGFNPWNPGRRPRAGPRKKPVTIRPCLAQYDQYRIDQSAIIIRRADSMSTKRLLPGFKSFVTLFDTGSFGSQSDRDLLHCFQTDPGPNGQEAFRILVERHGPMVLGLCRSVVRDQHEAEDAFQATFLVLVRKAASIKRRDTLGPWLHGVAAKVARRARNRLNDRRKREVPVRPRLCRS